MLPIVIVAVAYVYGIFNFDNISVSSLWMVSAFTVPNPFAGWGTIFNEIYDVITEAYHHALAGANFVLAYVPVGTTPGAQFWAAVGIVITVFLVIGVARFILELCAALFSALLYGIANIVGTLMAVVELRHSRRSTLKSNDNKFAY